MSFNRRIYLLDRRRANFGAFIENVGNMLIAALAAVTSDLAPLLRRIVLISEPALGERLYLDGIRLGPVSGGDQATASTIVRNGRTSIFQPVSAVSHA
ncbi:hypothetical protein [Methylobacterium currus]|uniref:hypothetical protein n=1 Tax=Methylobacterium currus TaxID=2051553 RepID=UPI001AECFBB6|nr:hypothetical protein [Methylobacterium currus]